MGGARGEKAAVAAVVDTRRHTVERRRRSIGRDGFPSIYSNLNMIMVREYLIRLRYLRTIFIFR